MAVRTKQDSAKVLSDTSGDKSFFCHDGCVSKNLRQLAECCALNDRGQFDKSGQIRLNIPN